MTAFHALFFVIVCVISESGADYCGLLWIFFFTLLLRLLDGLLGLLESKFQMDHWLFKVVAALFIFGLFRLLGLDYWDYSICNRLFRLF